MRLDDKEASSNVEDRRGQGGFGRGGIRVPIGRSGGGIGIGAALAIGDDRLQKRSQGYVVPENFTHGSSQQRASWLKRGMQTGNIASCDTFR